MQSRWQWLIVQVTRRLWFRAGLLSILAIATAFAAVVLKPYIPDDTETKIGAAAVDNILTIIASSMLAVTTFSLSTMVSAYSAATSNVTPRATRLLIEDTTTQNVLATFIGSFLFSLVGIILLSTGLYGEEGRVVLFVVTIGVIGIIVVTLLRWIDYLARLGRVGETTGEVEKTAAQALEQRRERPFLGGRRRDAASDALAAGAAPVFAASIGYVQHIDMPALSSIAADADLTIIVDALPGAFVAGGPLAHVAGPADDACLEKIGNAFTVAEVRSFDQDPRFGLSVLAEIASRALSPAINDPGTAIDVISRAVRLLAIWAGSDAPEGRAPEFPQIHVPPLAPDDLFDDVFSPIARDGAANGAVQVRLQKAFASLSAIGDDPFHAAAVRHSDWALQRAEQNLMIDMEKEWVRRLAHGDWRTGASA